MKNVLIFLLSIVIGVSFAFLLYDQYDEKEPIELVGKETEKVEDLYFLQFGVYSSRESMEQNTNSLMDYMYEEKEGKYYVYIGMTKLEENAEKIKGIYEEDGYHLYRKTIPVKGSIFLNELVSYDKKIKEETDNKKIKTYMREVLKRYKELILDVENEGTSKE